MSNATWLTPLTCFVGALAMVTACEPRTEGVFNAAGGGSGNSAAGSSGTDNHAHAGEDQTGGYPSEAGSGGVPAQSDAGAAGFGTGGLHEAGAAGEAGKASGPCTADMPFILIEPVEELNTENVETSARLSSDGLSVYFTSDRSRTAPIQRSLPYSDIYVAKRDRLLDDEGKPARFGEATVIKELSLPPDTPDLDLTLTGDGKLAFFDTYRDSPSGDNRAIWRAVLGENGIWESIEKVEVLSSPHEDMYPYLVPDGSAVYFTSSRTSNVTGFDVYYAPIIGGEVRSPGQVAINTREGEAHPVVSPDQLTLYFSSTRVRPGPLQKRGFSDIWMATRESKEDPFDDPRFLEEISSRAGEAPSYVSADGCTLYFDSERGDGQGKSDIYRAYRRLP